MQAYGEGFAKIYNRHWIRFAESLAPVLQQFYEQQPLSQHNKHVLDLCCGTGQLSRHFLENGYHTTGLDLSASMLTHARGNLGDYLPTGQAALMQADAAQFSLDRTYGLVVSLFDALNHLPDLTALKSCFASVYAVLANNGLFIFDLNTRAGLADHWNNINVNDQTEMVLINRGFILPETNRAYTHFTGFLQRPDGLYERIDETVYNTIFALTDVHAALLDQGFRQVTFAHADDLGTPVDQPEESLRIFIVATK